MAQSSVMVSLPQMVDLALNCPEVGAVNFNILHSLLHVLIQQVDLLECKVEFRGNDSERVQNLLTTVKPGPTLNLTEYIVTPGKDQRKVITKKAKYKKVKSQGGEEKKVSKEEIVVEQELKVIEPRKDSKEEPGKHPSPITSAHNLDSGSMQTVVVVEPTDGVATPHVSVALSRVHFDNMEEEIEKLKNEIKELKELPANMGLIEALRNASVDKSSPVLDMFQILTLAKRVDATETGISKLASMLEDLAREKVGGPEGSVPKGSGPEGSGPKGSGPEGSGARDVGTDGAKVIQTGLSENVKEKLDNLENRLEKLEEHAKKSGGDGEAPPEQRLNELEDKFADYTEQVATLDSMFNNQVTILQAQFTDLEKEIGEIVERINAGLPAGDIGADQNISELYNKIVQMQEDMESMANTAAKLLEDKEERQLNMDAMLEQIELLKTIKANREDLEDALADKADTCTVNRKVSHDQFDAACDDLSRGIEDALTKLTQQEQLWQQALDDIQREIENKLDKMELTPLRDFVHNKLKMLQERLRALAALKKETEAAGTKSKFLRNVNCISCDKDVIMRKQMDPTLMPPPPALPPTKSMAPYLAYELDSLRKQQKCMPHSRNMNHFESAMSGAKGKGDEDHICNRYCGGSHTVTTPQQRVARLGHFLQQWGPETAPVTEGQIRGTDGQFYKSREGGDITPGRPPSREAEDSESFFPSAKSRPSMVVHGDILAARSAVRSTLSKMSESERASQLKSGAEQRESQGGAAQDQRQSISSQKRDSQRISSSAGARGSKDASKRPSRASAGRVSQQRGSHASHISFKAAAEGGEPPEAGDAAPPPTEGEAAPPAEGEAAPPAEGEAAETAPAEPEAAEEAPSAEPEAPAEDAPPTE